MKCPNCRTEIDPACRFCPTCGKEISHSEGQEASSYRGEHPYMERQEMPMKWYKFVIYVQLFLSLLSALGTAMNFFMGIQYGEYAEHVYAYYGGLKAIDILMGVLCLGQVVLVIAARQSLAHFRKNGPNLYYAVWGYSIVSNIVHIIGLVAVGAAGEGMSAIVGQIIGAAIMLVLNVMYFKKRMHLFVN